MCVLLVEVCEQNTSPVHKYPDILKKLLLFLCRFKNFHVHTYQYSNRICPSTHIRHVSRWQQSMRRKPRKICILQFASTSIEPGNEVAILSSIHGKELGSIFLRHGIKKVSGFNLASTRFKVHRVIKNFHSGEQIQKVADSYTGFTEYMWTG